MQHTIELDKNTEQLLSVVAIDHNQSKDDVLLLAVKDFLKQQKSKNDLKQFLQPYQLNMEEVKFDREDTNER